MFEDWKKKIVASEGGYDSFSKGYTKRGFVIEKDCVKYSEWAPNAVQAHLVGDFSKRKKE